MKEEQEWEIGAGKKVAGPVCQYQDTRYHIISKFVFTSLVGVNLFHTSIFLARGARRGSSKRQESRSFGDGRLCG